MTPRLLIAAAFAALLSLVAAPAYPTSEIVVTVSSAPPIRTASSGTVGGTVTAVVRWATPSRTGGGAVHFYQIRAYRLDPSNRVVRIHHASSQVPAARALSVKLPRGRYKFRVQAWNKAGGSAWSQASRIVTAR